MDVYAWFYAVSYTGLEHLKFCYPWGSWNQSSTDTEEQLSFLGAKNGMWIFNRAEVSTPKSYAVQVSNVYDNTFWLLKKCVRYYIWCLICII